ncbi:MAG: XdhC family protein [Lachnospiraceae bacterium]|nr:XdhC family protein [Lachnospiraceae bacterium]
MSLKEYLYHVKQHSEYTTFTLLTGEHAGERSVTLTDSFSRARRRISYADGEGASRPLVTGFSDDKNGTFEVNDEKIYVERTVEQDELVVLGCGHVSIPLIIIANMAGFKVTAVDDREKYVEDAREAGADDCVCRPFSEFLQYYRGNDHTFFVIVTREHKYDAECLRELLNKPCAYIGMMGAKKRVAAVKEKLLSEGFSKESFDILHTPIGLPINSDTPPEIAISIMAEIIRERHKKENIRWPDDILEEIIGQNHYAGHSILCTVVSKKGSAPREIGARMLVRDDGKVINTIGGGPTELFFINKCMEIFRSIQDSGSVPGSDSIHDSGSMPDLGSMPDSGSMPNSDSMHDSGKTEGSDGKEAFEKKAGLPLLVERDLGSPEAAAEGEYCGGLIKVFLEWAT